MATEVAFEATTTLPVKLGEQPVNVRLTLALLIEEPVDIPLDVLPLESVPLDRVPLDIVPLEVVRLPVVPDGPLVVPPEPPQS